MVMKRTDAQLGFQTAVRLTVEQVDRLNQLRKLERDLPSAGEMMRRLIDRAFENAHAAAE